MWAAKLYLRNAYRPAECTVAATATTCRHHCNLVGNIGRGIGLRTWIADPSDNRSLAPIGAAGELLLEGTLVGKGYFHDPEKAAVSLVEDPPWLLCGGRVVQGGRAGCTRQETWCGTLTGHWSSWDARTQRSRSGSSAWSFHLTKQLIYSGVSSLCVPP